MVGKIASPVFLNGPEDKLLVGDTVDVVATETASVQQTQAPGNYEEFLAGNGNPVQKTDLISAEGKKLSGITDAKSAGTVARIDALNLNDKDSAISLVKNLVESGDIKSLAGNERAINDLMTATGMEDRLRDLSSDFDLKDFKPDVKLDILENFDWDSDMDVESMSGLFANMESMWPSIDFGEFKDSLGMEALKDATFMQSLLGDAEWLDDSILGSMLDSAGDSLAGLSDSFLRKALSDFASEKQVALMRQIIKRLDPSILKVLNENLVEQILKVYPLGYTQSYRGTLKEAYETLVADLEEIDPEWYLINRNGEKINWLGPYYKASDQALYVFSYDEPHATNAMLVKFHDKIGYEKLMVNGVLVPKGTTATGVNS